MDDDDVKWAANKLDEAYEEECRNRPPYYLAAAFIGAFIAWIIIAFIICNSKARK